MRANRAAPCPDIYLLQITLILILKKMILQNSFLRAQFIPIHRDHAPNNSIRILNLFLIT